jgi:sec-independent protein translocase protein TatA
MGLGFTEILLILLAIVILFGLGKLPRAMGDIGKGIHAFKAGLKDAEKEEAQKTLEQKKPGE